MYSDLVLETSLNLHINVIFLDAMSIIVLSTIRDLLKRHISSLAISL